MKAALLAQRLDRGPQPGRVRTLDGAKLIPARPVAGDKAVRRHVYFFLALLDRQFALGRGGCGRQRGFDQRLEVGSGTAKEKIVGVLDAFGPLNDVRRFDQRAARLVAVRKRFFF